MKTTSFWGSEMQEILVLVIVVLAVIFVPRLMPRKPASTSGTQNRIQSRAKLPDQGVEKSFVLTGWMRLVVVITFLWIAGCAVYFKPWEGGSLLFFCLTLGPTVVLWGGLWVWFGYKKYRR